MADDDGSAYYGVEYAVTQSGALVGGSYSNGRTTEEETAFSSMAATLSSALVAMYAAYVSGGSAALKVVADKIKAAIAVEVPNAAPTVESASLQGRSASESVDTSTGVAGSGDSASGDSAGDGPSDGGASS